MTVPLLPPATYSTVTLDVQPLAEGPRFVRTRNMSRWHRPRTGVQYGERTIYGAWCGYSIGGSERAGGFLAAEQPPTGELVCATCDGRAVGAGQEQDGPDGRALVFSPRGLTPPRHCPGSRTTLYEALPGGTAARCLACRDVHPIRAMGGPYASRCGIVQHPPGAALCAPCPFHRWRHPTARNGRLMCTCGRPLATPR